MNGKELKKVVLFMANKWCRGTAVAIFGKVMGEHFWHKWCSAYEFNGKGADYATMRLFYEMTTDNLEILCAYIDANYAG